LLLADPAVVLAISTAKTEAQPLIAALEEFHRYHGAYPTSVRELPKNGLWGKYLYKAQPLSPVYKSLDCQKRIHDSMGWQTPEKLQKMAETQAECLLGYSQFTIKSQVQPANVWNQSMFAYVMLESDNPDCVRRLV